MLYFLSTTLSSGRGGWLPGTPWYIEQKSGPTALQCESLGDTHTIGLPQRLCYHNCLAWIPNFLTLSAITQTTKLASQNSSVDINIAEIECK